MKKVKDFSIEELGQKIEEFTDAETRKIFNGKSYINGKYLSTYFNLYNIFYFIIKLWFYLSS